MSKNKSLTANWQPDLPDAQIRYYQNFLSNKEANHFFDTFLSDIPWQRDNIKLFGKIYKQPRLTSFHSNKLSNYSYSGVILRPSAMTSELLTLMKRIQTVCDHEFNCVLLNLYRDGSDSNGWHADNEKELGVFPQIASFSLGTNRFFHFKHRQIKTEKYKIELHHGSLLLMEGPMQANWLHQIPKTKKPLSPRINLTFRKII
jgi:alkylated DNA repair dioxygenase AlkB